MNSFAPQAAGNGPVVHSRAVGVVCRMGISGSGMGSKIEQTPGVVADNLAFIVVGDSRSENLTELRPGVH